MSITQIDPGTPVQFTLSTPATIEAGVALVDASNLTPAPGALGTDDIANDSGVAGATCSAALDQLDTDVGAAQADATQAIADAAAAQADATQALADALAAQGDATQALADAAAAQGDATQALADSADALSATSIMVHIDDIISATGEVGGVDGYAGTITRISVVANAAIAVGDLIVTFSINGTPITNGAVTLPAATGALTRVAASPTALNVVAANDVISWAVSGGNTAAGSANVRITIDTTVP